ncbi:DUF1707 SHOCT-like domain-containing protein [Planotetraspora kaengkrachanensis]|uniref:DUF1707 domain-containing protein n=1 Tax=Planotetraspora kaengkrachanensis TaxID=575193 RepID=A0A8J3LWK8_9ACTN|nr:DUF1707 domain-containing protein [Planotetraspora kaengkrachanensis]GIG79762.1 hypothetical protein Pka01_28890 [Planotetraspora kaengkrachanensis]
MASPDEMRIGDRERDEVTRSLHDAFVQGRITRDELDQRLDATLTARTAGDLRRVTADLPGADLPGSDVPHGIGAAPYRPTRGTHGMPWEHDGPPWQRRHGDLATWGPHLAAARRRAHRGRVHRGGPPAPLLVVGGLVLLAMLTGTAWPLFAVLKVMFVIWLIMAVAGLAHHRRGHRHRPPGIGS